MGILRMLIRGTREKLEESSLRRDLEQKLGHKVSEEEMYSLGSHLDAAPSGGNKPLQYTQRDSATPFADAKPPMKTLTKLLLIGIPLLLLGTIAVAGFVMIMPQRQYDRLNPFSPKPPEGTFPAALGNFSLTQKPDYIAPASYAPNTSFEGEYVKGADKVTYTLWVYKSADEMNADYEKRKNYLKPNGKSKIVEESDKRFAVAAVSGFYNYILYKDGNNLRQISAFNQLLALEFEGLLKNAPPLPVVSVNEAELTKAASNGDSTITVQELINDYKTTPDIADKKYKDKTIVFTGTVAIAEKNTDGKPYIALLKPGSTKPAEGMALCNFDKSQESAVLKFRKGDAIKLQGKVSGNFPMGIWIDDCSIK